MLGAPKKILLVGSNGFIGRHLTQHFSRNGHFVIGVGRSEGPVENCVYHQCNLARHEGIRDILSKEAPDIVIHLACSSSPSSNRSFSQEKTEYIDPSCKLVDLAEELKIPNFVYFSSGGSVYGDTHSHKNLETDPLKPKSNYAAAKVVVENYIRDTANGASTRRLILRPSNPFGAHQAVTNDHGLISKLIQAAYNKTAFTLYGDGSAVRDYIHISDLCLGVDAAIDSNLEGTYNLGSGSGHSVLEVIEAVSKVLSTSFEICHRNQPQAAVDKSVLDISRICRDTSWSPLLDLISGIEQTI